MRVGRVQPNGLPRKVSSIPALPSGFAIFSINVGPHLPIYFHSPGGLTDNGLAIGRMLRERGMTAGVARTIPKGCIGQERGGCRALKRSGTTLMARWRGINAGCNSSCVYALIGATVRHVPPGARVGIHASKVPYIGEWERLFANAQLASFNLELHNYIHEMGINDDLYDEIQKVPFEQVRILTRNEIAILGSTPAAFRRHPGPWSRPHEPSVRARSSSLPARTDAHQDEFRSSLVRLSCGEHVQINVRYERELGLDKVRAAEDTVQPRGPQSVWSRVRSG